MSSRLRALRLSRIGVTASASVLLAGGTFLVPSSASASSSFTQPVTIVTSVNSVVGAPTYTGAPTTVSFAVTNKSTKGAKLDAFSIVVPPGPTGVARAGVFGPGNWNETVLKCGGMSHCAAIVLVSAGLPLRNSLVSPGGTVTASISFKAPASPTTLSFPFIGIGNGIFSAQGATPTVTVLDGSVASFGVAVATPVTAGQAANVVVTTLNAQHQVVPFQGGPVTYTITGDDAAATLQGTAFGSGKSVVISIPATTSGIFTSPAIFTKAQLQSVQAKSGSFTGTSSPFTVGSGAPASLQLTSITDTSQSPALPTPVVGQTFASAFTAYDAYGNVATTAGVPVTLSALNSAGGSFNPAVPTGATSADGTGVISASFSAAQIGLNLQVSSPGLLSGTRSTDVDIAGDSETGTPGTPADLSAGNASADLPNGSYGPVFLTTAPCTDDNCGQGVEITLDGTFTDPNANPTAPAQTHLYTDAAPASVSWTCADADCPHPDAEPPGETYLGNDGDDDDEQAEDFAAYPIQVSLKVGGVYQPFQTAPSCRDLSDPQQEGLTGQIISTQAIAAGFCVDVYAISRSDDDSFTGDLTLPVLFVEDPKLRPT